jgi:anthranilate phosphoribosyltransferase
MRDQLAKVMRGCRLDEEEAGAAMAVIMDGLATPAQIGALLAALAARGETEDEIVGFARTMRSRAVPLPSRGAIDTCGTGGDGACTFNISTVASLIVAACGVSVAKHGNRSASGSCGSADVLEALGLRVDPPPATVERSLAELGWAFLFAPSFHAATRHAAGPRKELGVRTAFNLLGPLTNPALPEAQVVGVPRPELTGFMARCLKRLGVRRAWVVHGAGLDELAPCGPTTVASFDDLGTRCFVVDPAEAGIEPCDREALRGGDAATNAAIARGVLGGDRGPRRDAALLNAAAALVVAGRAGDLREGVAQAAEAVDSGRAADVLHRAREISRP